MKKSYFINIAWNLIIIYVLVTVNIALWNCNLSWNNKLILSLASFYYLFIGCIIPTIEIFKGKENE